MSLEADQENPDTAKISEERVAMLAQKLRERAGLSFDFRKLYVGDSLSHKIYGYRPLSGKSN